MRYFKAIEVLQTHPGATVRHPSWPPGKHLALLDGHVVLRNFWGGFGIGYHPTPVDFAPNNDEWQATPPDGLPAERPPNSACRCQTWPCSCPCHRPPERKQVTPAELAEVDAAVHPNGRCTCGGGGEGTCEWCVRTSALRAMGQSIIGESGPVVDFDAVTRENAQLRTEVTKFRAERDIALRERDEARRRPDELGKLRSEVDRLNAELRVSRDLCVSAKIRADATDAELGRVRVALNAACGVPTESVAKSLRLKRDSLQGAQVEAGKLRSEIDRLNAELIKARRLEEEAKNRAAVLEDLEDERARAPGYHVFRFGSRWCAEGAVPNHSRFGDTPVEALTTLWSSDETP